MNDRPLLRAHFIFLTFNQLMQRLNFVWFLFFMQQKNIYFEFEFWNEYLLNLLIKYHLKETWQSYMHRPLWPLSIALIGVIHTCKPKEKKRNRQKVIFSPSFGLNKIDLWLTGMEYHERKASLRKRFMFFHLYHRLYCLLFNAIQHSNKCCPFSLWFIFI